MKILAFDQATRKTGAAWFDGTVLMGFTTLDYSRIRDSGERMRKMIEGMYALIAELKPDALVFEGVAMQRSAGAVILLAQLQGSLIGYCYGHGIPGMIYKPSVWRGMLGFKQGSRVKREQLKKQARDFVKEHYEIEASEDEADAICIGCAFACEYERHLQEQAAQNETAADDGDK